MMDGQVREFLRQLGVEQADGLAFFSNVLLPVLTQSDWPLQEAESVSTVALRLAKVRCLKLRGFSWQQGQC